MLEKPFKGLATVKGCCDGEEGEGINLKHRGHCFERVDCHAAPGGFEVVHVLGIRPWNHPRLGRAKSSRAEGLRIKTLSVA